MDRSLDPGDRSEPRVPAQTDRSAPLPADRRDASHQAAPRRPADRIREDVRGGRRAYSLSPYERLTMNDLGRFRVIVSGDLSQLRYDSKDARMQQDIRSLMAQGLVQRKTVWTGRPRVKETFYTLTPSGKVFTKRDSAQKDQAIYAGFVKPAELRHDAAIYRVFHREVERINQEGGRVRRVVLDFELKKKAYRPLAKAKALAPADYAKRQAEIAHEHGLKVVNGHIAFPDLRIEYELPSGASAQVDLEVASGSYHGSHAAEKVAAGFRIYAAHEDAARLSAALEEREITAEILSL